MNKLDLGAVSAYAMAVEQGYEGTEEEFAALQANSGNNALRAENAADRAQQILDSIPLDFQEVSQGVATLTEEIGATERIEIGALVDGYFVHPNGSTIAIDTFACTEFVPIPAGAKRIDLVCTIPDGASFVVYDDKKAVLLCVNGTNAAEYGLSNTTAPQLVDVVLPHGAAYFRASYLKASFDSLDNLYATARMLDTVSAEIVGLKNNVSSLQETASREDLTEKIGYTDGFYVNAGGWITSISPTLYSISDLVPIVKGQKITVTCALATPGVIAGLSRWTRDKEFVETIYTSTSNSVETMEYTAGDDVEYLMICYHHLNGNADKPTVIVTPVMTGHEAAKAAMEMLNSHEDKPPTPILPYEYAAGKVLCIGDSLTSGAYYGQGWTGASIQQNYPYYLGRMLNCEVTNGGQSGWSASDWYRDYITTHNYADYDTVIIWLGTNYGCTAMPTDAEIEAFVPDASVSPETANQALYLIKIIETIQAANPDCFILVCGVFASKSDVTANNDVVQQIAAKYGLHYVDTMELSTSAKPELHAGVANVHFGKAGNIYIANKFANEIRSIISKNPLLAEFGLTNRTN